MTDDVTACKEQKSTTRDEVQWRDCCSLHAVTSSVIYYSTHTEKCNLFVLYNKNSNGLLKDFWGMKKEEKKSADVIWRGFDAICVCLLIDHGQQPMKMHTEVTLLYKYIYIGRVLPQKEVS